MTRRQLSQTEEDEHVMQTNIPIPYIRADHSLLKYKTARRLMLSG